MDHLHRSILKRIFWAWLFVSVASVAFIFLIGIQRFDSLTTRMAFAETDRALHPSTVTEGLGGRPYSSSFKAIQDHLAPEVCLLRLYGPQGTLIEELAGPSFQGLDMAAGSGLKDLPRDGRPHLNHFELSQGTFLQWMVPVRNTTSPRVRFIEGVLLLNEHDVWMLTTSIRVGALAVLFSITATSLALYPLMLSLNRRLLQSTSEIAGGQIEILSVLSAAIAKRDTETSDHNSRVTLYAIRLAEAFGVERLDMQALILGSLLHDVGKIGIRDDILLKPGPLTEQEAAVMRSHVQKGLEIVSLSRWLHPSMDVIHCHHEHCDGSGYPEGRIGDAIPLAGRLFAIVDVFDALTSPRAYKEPWPVENAMEYIQERSGTQFDPSLVEAFQVIAHEAHAEAHGISRSELLAILMQAAEPYHVVEVLDSSGSKRRKSRAISWRPSSP